MIIDKKKKLTQETIAPPQTEKAEVISVPEQVGLNGPIEILTAIKEILREVTWKYGVADSPKIFNTVQLDDGQYERIIHPEYNLEDGISFPAAFIHFINWRYLTQQSRFNEGRATLRIRFILNDLNPHEEDFEMRVLLVAERINQAIQENKSKYSCLQERCNLQYIDPMESFDRSLQPCWMTFDVWFKQENVWVKRNKIYKKLVFPPFTNHSDQTAETQAECDHSNIHHNASYDEVSGYIKNIPPTTQETE